MRFRNDVYTYRLVLFTLISIFSIYNIVVYQRGGQEANNGNMSVSALKGSMIYQQKNCTACHQLYGLGGYLGPDLTNCYSAENKGSNYIKAMLNSGIKTMPKFNFTAAEIDDLTAFLTHVDSTGFYPNLYAETELSGWVKLKYKVNEIK